MTVWILILSFLLSVTPVIGQSFIQLASIIITASLYAININPSVVQNEAFHRSHVQIN